MVDEISGPRDVYGRLALSIGMQSEKSGSSERIPGETLAVALTS